MKNKTFIIVLIIAIWATACYILYIEKGNQSENTEVAKAFNVDSVVEINSDGQIVSGQQEEETTTTETEGTVQSGDTNFEKKDLELDEKTLDELTIKDIAVAKFGEDNILITNVKNNSSETFKDQLVRIQILNSNGEEIENVYSVIKAKEAGEESEWNTKIETDGEEIRDVIVSKVVPAENVFFNN